MCGYFVTSSRRRNHVCVPEGGPKSREGGTLSLCRETYFHLLHSPLCSQLSGCLLLLLLVLEENGFFLFFQLLLLVVSIPLLSLPIIFLVCVGRMQIIISGWKGGRPNVKVRIPHILCWWHFFSFLFLLVALSNWKWRLPPSLGLHSFLNGCQTRLSHSSSPETFSVFGFPPQ